MEHSFDALADRVVDRISEQLREIPVVLPEYLTLRQVARFCGLSLSSLERLVRKGEGPPATRFTDRAIRYRLADVRAWAKGRSA